jgi:hypothetical protein
MSEILNDFLDGMLIELDAMRGQANVTGLFGD